MPGAGLMIPVRHAMARGGAGGGFSSTSTLTLSQPNLIEAQQLQLEHQIDQNGQSNEDFDSKSCSENMEAASGDELENPRAKRKRYHRHTQHQIQQLETFFKECPHPDDKQRKELSRELSLEPLQVKFWFQNKRTQMKNHHERQENTQLRTENEKLRAENMRYKEALGAASCPTCGGPVALGEMSFDEHHLRMENSHLREEIDRISGMAAKYVGKPISPLSPLAPHQLHRPSLDLGVGNVGGVHAGAIVNELLGTGDLLRSIQNHTSNVKKPMVIELAVAAMEEFVQMAQLGKPLWLSAIDSGTDLLDDEEYFRTFPRGIGPRPFGLKSEASRDVSLVIMNPVHLVEMLMDVNQWASVFSGIVSRATTVDVLSTGVAGNYNGALQLMSAEFQLPTPLVPTRESYFVRYCKQHTDGMWAVVDVSLDNLNPTNVVRTRRRPSGCLIQEMPNGYSKVTWVEHVEVDDSSVHNIYKSVVNSGLAFGAKRWVATLQRQCERLASVMASNIIPPGEAGVVTTQQGRKSMLKLAERMVISFSNGVSASTSQQWTAISGSGADDLRVMTRKSVDDPGRPPGIVLSAATSFWIPVPPKRVFDFLRNENSRNEWDILSNGSAVQEMAHIANGREQGNCVSLLRVNSANSNQSNMLILQESCTDATGSFVIYAPVDIAAMDMVLNGGDPDYVALLPSGFSILPDGPPGAKNGGVIGDVGTGGSLLTVAFQILVDSVPTAKLSLGSVATVNRLISCTVERIKAAVSSDSTQ